MVANIEQASPHSNVHNFQPVFTHYLHAVVSCISVSHNSHNGAFSLCLEYNYVHWLNF